MSIEQACRLVAEANRITAFSGAGISTESGIPDYRSPNGVWARNRTVYFDEFVSSRDGRIEYWRQKFEMWPEMRAAKPNAGHLALAELERQGKLTAMITQNIDGLHRRAGHSAERIIELHGTMLEASCLTCGERCPTDNAMARVGAGELAPECRTCGGFLKPATVSFGQQLPADAIDRATAASLNCDVFLAVGSSLVVHPAAGFPVLARQRGAKLIIVNRTPTPLDGVADLVINEEIGKVLPALIGAPR